MLEDVTVVSRVISGSVWTLGLRVCIKGMGAVQLLILARLLVPEEFGLFAVALLTLLGFEVLTRTGIDDAIIHKRHNIESYLHTAFWIQIVRGIVLATLAILAAPYIAVFFNEPGLAPVVSTLALVQVLRGFRSIGVILLQRDINFRTESIYQGVGEIVRVVATLVLVWQFRSVWALVYGAIIGEASLLVLSYFVHPYRPRFTFTLDKAKELLQFGVWLFLAGIVSYLALQADSIFVGKWLCTETLGVYYMAYNIANLFFMEIARPLGKVLKPAYAILQTEPDRLRVALEKSLAILLAIFLPIAIIFIVAAQPIVSVLLGDKWEAIIPIFPILVLGGLFRGLGTIGMDFFIATGKPKIAFYVELAKAICLMIGLYPFFMLGGLEGIAWASTMSTIILMLLLGVKLAPLMHHGSFVTKELLSIGLSTACIGLVLFLESTAFPSTWYTLIMMMFTVTVLYVGILWFFVGEQAHLNYGKTVVRQWFKWAHK